MELQDMKFISFLFLLLTGSGLHVSDILFKVEELFEEYEDWLNKTVNVKVSSDALEPILVDGKPMSGKNDLAKVNQVSKRRPAVFFSTLKCFQALTFRK